MLQDAVVAAEHHVAACPTDAAALTTLGALLIISGLPRRALDYLARVPDGPATDTTRAAQRNRAAALLACACPVESADAWAQVAPTDVVGLSQYARALFLSGHLDTALAQYRRALAAAGDGTVVGGSNGKHDDDNSINNGADASADVAIGAAIAALRLGDASAARSLLSAHVGHARTLLALTTLALRVGPDAELASQALSRLAAIAPCRMTPAARLDVALVRACFVGVYGRLAEARAELQRAVHEHPDHAVAWARLAAFQLACNEDAVASAHAGAGVAAAAAPAAPIATIAPIAATTATTAALATGGHGPDAGRLPAPAADAPVVARSRDGHRHLGGLSRDPLELLALALLARHDATGRPTSAARSAALLAAQRGVMRDPRVGSAWATLAACAPPTVATVRAALADRARALLRDALRSSTEQQQQQGDQQQQQQQQHGDHREPDMATALEALAAAQGGALDAHLAGRIDAWLQDRLTR